MTGSCAVAAILAALCSTALPPPSSPLVSASLVTATSGPGAAAERATHGGVADAWLGEDKLQHLGLSFAATTMAYAAARVALDAGTARVTAGATAAALGLGKEISDRRRGGRFSIRDLVWDSAGVVLGLALIRTIP